LNALKSHFKSLIPDAWNKDEEMEQKKKVKYSKTTKHRESLSPEKKNNFYIDSSGMK
jgi:glutamate synthase domain-containing protein 1